MKNRAKIEREILCNANQAATAAELYLLSESEPQQFNIVLAKLLNRHVIKFMSNSYANAA